MKRMIKAERLPFAAGLLALITLGVRWGMYAFSLDAKNLVPGFAPLAVAHWVLAVFSAACLLVSVWKAEGPAGAAGNFRAGAAGAAAAGLGIALTVLSGGPAVYSGMNTIWMLLGLLSGAALIWEAVCRLTGRENPVPAGAAVCLFLMVHIMGRYRFWSSDPQLLDYCFEMLADMTLALFCYHHGAARSGMAKGKQLAAFGLLAAYCCIVCLKGTGYPFLHLGCGIWALTDLAVPESEG